MPRKLKREYRLLPTSLDGVRLIVARTIRLGGGKVLLAGTDVTEQAKSWKNLRSLLLRGNLISTPEVNPNKIGAAPKPTPKSETEEPLDSDDGGDPSLFSDFASKSKRQLLNEAKEKGYEVSSAMSKAEIIEILGDNQ